MAKSLAAGAAAPDQKPLTGLQAQRLAQLANVPLREVQGRSVAQLSEALKWRIDPEWFGFRRVCGQVVRWDPTTGMYQPVPFATVHVMDTDCDFLGYFPLNTKLAWLYPIWCHEEEITSVVTDACGKFCVWVPWFDVDWVVRWRRELYCFPEVFVPPNIGDLLTGAGLIPQPIPGPDPGPIELQQAGLTLDQLAGAVGRETASALLLASQAAGPGAGRSTLQSLLRQPAYSHKVPPPTSSRLHALRHHESGAGALRELVRGKAEREYRLDLNRYVGPFPLWRCEWVWEKEIVPILEVPDITFWVTQDTDGDGDQETIYTDGWFQIGWKSGPLSDVILHASPIARINGSCEVPPVGPCEVPEITFAGLIPVTPSPTPYLDTTGGPNRGTSTRVNPAHADGQIRASVFPPPAVSADGPATAPFMGTVQLYGCTAYPNAEYYRLMYSHDGAAAVPFTNISWWLDPFPGPGAPLHVTPDAQGWYPILTPADAWFPPNELLDWATGAYPDGLYDITLEIGDGSKTVIYTSSPAVPIRVDNSAPYAPLGSAFVSVSWRALPGGAWFTFPNLICPIVHRSPGQDLEFQVQYNVAATHLLKVNIGGSGCGGGTLLPVPSPTVPPYVQQPNDPEYQHWHTSPTDNSVSRTAHFVLPGSALAGCYGFSVNAYSRAFNPAGGDGSNPQGNDWYVDTQSLIWTQWNLSVAVIDV